MQHTKFSGNRSTSSREEVEIGPPVPEKKIFEVFLPYMGVEAILVMWQASCSLIFISLYLKAYI